MAALQALRRTAAQQLVRGGGGVPYPGSAYFTPTKPLPEGADMIWDDGTSNREPVLDIYAPRHFTLGSAAAWFAGGCGVFYGIYLGCQFNDKASKRPWAVRETCGTGLPSDTAS